MHTCLNNKDIHFYNDNHFHEPQPDRAASKLVMTNMKDRACVTSEKPRTIINECLTQLLVHAALYLSSNKNLTQLINRTRRAINDFGTDGKDRQQITIKDKYKYTSGETDENRIIILGTSDNLDLLSKEDAWYVDGTFNISPDTFTQVFTVNVIINNKNLPLVFALLPNKQKVSYSRVFECLVSNVSNKPKYIMSDFEKGITSCVKEIFKGTNVGGCYFHLASNLWKKVVNNGSRKVFRKEEVFRKFFNYLKVIPFIPIRDMIFVFNQLRKAAPNDIIFLYDYFENNYIGGLVNESSRTRSVPLFPIATWNVHERVIRDLPRSNNSLEAWHRSLAQDLSSHPNVNKCIKHFLREQHATEIAIEQLKSGYVFERLKWEIKRYEAIKMLYESYERKNYQIVLDNLVAILKS
ncbi:hypothetical protein BpHYR1_037581 [Brachionus plicatilis]|uniref:MULE transposase domain-containing protein n=1 Tax=Brachionus plicatilis TaxID=10195 RepID=A0A3M7QG95_BRAPC|nr:hypothetical protein BpHYR1_037581 [Brachionus plicatilis]